VAWITKNQELRGYAADGLIACRSCDCLHRIVDVPAGGKACCRRCDDVLYRHLPRSLDNSAALYLAAFILLLLANTFPFVALQYGDRIEQSLLISGGFALQQAGMGEIGLLVFLTSVMFPFLTTLSMLYLLLPLRIGVRPPQMTLVWRLVRLLSPWSLIGVFMLGLLVSVVKLQDLAMIIPGVAFYAFIALLVVSSAAAASFDPAVLWPRQGPAAGIRDECRRRPERRQPGLRRLPHMRASGQIAMSADAASARAAIPGLAACGKPKASHARPPCWLPRPCSWCRPTCIR
jgi:paraquat-inducible protein A